MIIFAVIIVVLVSLSIYIGLKYGDGRGPLQRSFSDCTIQISDDLAICYLVVSIVMMIVNIFLFHQIHKVNKILNNSQEGAFARE